MRESECDRASIGYIEAFDRAGHVEAGEMIAIFSGEAAHAFAFAAEHQREGAGQWRLLEWRRGLRVEADAQIAHISQLLERAGEIDDAHNSDMLKAAGSRLRNDSGHVRGMAFRHHQGVDAEGRRGSKDRADIMGICDLIEHEDDAASRGDVAEIEGLERPRLDHHALMHRIGAEPPREVLALDDMGD